MMINVHTSVIWNTIDYAYYMLQNMADMAHDPSDVRFNIYCQDAHSYEFVKSSRKFGEYGSTVFNVARAGQGSMQHAKCIETMISRFDPDETNAIVDADTVMLAFDWDITVNDVLKEHHVFGCAYDDRLCTASAEYYRDISTLSWIVLAPGVDLKGFDPLPDKNESFVVDFASAELFNVPEGHILVKDTGWRLPQFMKENSLVDCALVRSSEDVVFKGDNHFVEYHWSGAPFMAHMQRSSKLPFRMTRRSREFYDSCERYIDTLYDVDR